MKSRAYSELREELLGRRYDASLAVHARLAYQMLAREVAGNWYPGIIVRPHRLFSPGDVVFGAINNGTGERFPFTGWSRKKGVVDCYYMQHARNRLRKDKLERFTDSCPVRLVDVPGELEALPLSHPECRRTFVDALRAAYSAFRVGTGSPELFS